MARKKKKAIQIVKANPAKGLMHDTVINHNRTNTIPAKRTKKVYSGKHFK